MTHEVTIREVPAQMALTVRFTTDMEKVSEDMMSAFQEIWELMQENNYVCNGDFFALYHDEEFNPEAIDAECCISVDKALPEKGRVKYREVAGGLFASTLHKGPYTTLESAYNDLLAWVAQNGYRPLPKMRDVYQNDPADVAPEELLTEVLCPVEKI